MFTLMTQSVPAVPVMSVPCMVSLMSVVIAVVPIVITASMVGGVTMLPMVIRKSCPLVTELAILLVIGMTIVWTMSQWGSAALTVQ